MLEELKENCVDFKPNYDNTNQEPVVLPSKFPYILCGNNSGIAVGMSCDLVSHNFTEVAAAIKYYMKNKDCSVADLMQFIKGPDFPTGGQILNGEDLLDIYTTGQGSVKVFAHYEIVKKGNKTLLVFHDLPYNVEIDSGIKEKLQKLLLEEGYSEFKDVYVSKAGPRNFDITIVLDGKADVQKSLEILFKKTKLSNTIKINQTVIVNDEPRRLSLKELIAYWVDFRSSIIKKIATNNYNKTNKKLTVTIGLQKCMSNIDKLIELIRSADNTAAAKSAIIKEFDITSEQADAVLDMKLGRLSRLDIVELNNEEKKLEETLAKLREIKDNEEKRYEIIVEQLEEIKKTVGEDKRLTEILYSKETKLATLTKREWPIYSTGIELVDTTEPSSCDLVEVVMATAPGDIYGYNAAAEMSPVMEPCVPLIGAFAKGNGTRLVGVTKSGRIKVSSCDLYNWKRTEKIMKLKDDDELVFAGTATDDDYLILFNGVDRVLKIPMNTLTDASKMTLGVMSGFDNIASASIVSSNDKLLMINEDKKGKLTPVIDFSDDNRTNKGQIVAEKTIVCKVFAHGRESFYIIPKTGNKLIKVSENKISVKGKTAVGATVTNRIIERIV